MTAANIKSIRQQGNDMTDHLEIARARMEAAERAALDAHDALLHAMARKAADEPERRAALRAADEAHRLAINAFQSTRREVLHMTKRPASPAI